MTFDELPVEWQRRVKRLREEVGYLRKGHHVPVGELPRSWQREFSRLRGEIAKLRIQRNEARAELAALRAELGR